MKKKIYVVGLTVYFITFCVFLGSGGFLVAGERIIVDGKISTIKDNIGNITMLNLLTDGGEVFNITLNENGKKLGKEMDGKMVEVIGEVYDRGGDMWMEVRSYKKFEEKIFD